MQWLQCSSSASSSFSSILGAKLNAQPAVANTCFCLTSAKFGIQAMQNAYMHTQTGTDLHMYVCGVYV